MGYWKHYIDVWVTPIEGSQWYLYINDEPTTKQGEQRFLYEARTENTISIYVANATYAGTWNLNQWVEDEFTITAKSGTGGTLSANKSKATAGTTVTLTPTANSGYVFKDYTKNPSSLAITNNQFTMPSKNVTVTANWWKLSTGSLSKKSMNGGETITLTITAQTTGLSHKYKLSFGANMETGWVDVAAGTKSVNITVPLNWSAQLPNTTSQSGGTLTLRTYNGSTNLGNTTITGLTYKVPSSVKPTMGTITASIARTIGNVTFANIGNVYAQNHCGVRVQASASGQQSATIVGLSVKIGSYEGNKYNKTVTTSSVDFTSGVLGTAGTNKITVTATDSRGRTNSASVNITVSAYYPPRGSLSVWRCNSAGTRDDMGVYGKYSLTKEYSAIGNNTLTWTLTTRSQTKTSPANTGDLLPSNRLEFSETKEYSVVLTLTDGLETTTITAKLPSAMYMMAFYSTDDADKIGVMKYPNKSVPAGKTGTFEISPTTQVYIGDKTIESLFLNAIHVSKSITGGTNTCRIDFSGGVYTFMILSMPGASRTWVGTICVSGDGTVYIQQINSYTGITVTAGTNYITVTFDYSSDANLHMVSIPFRGSGVPEFH